MAKPKRAMTGKRLASRLARLKRGRGKRHERARAERRRRGSLTVQQRARVLEKTDGRCHMCGGKVDGDWHADHVLAHSGGGPHHIDNFLAAHRLCNGYRWDYSPKEFQLILKLGCWVAHQIRQGTPLGRCAADAFVRKELRREQRRRV